jgi:sulfur carrier protein ThiS adenylyltransferase
MRDARVERLPAGIQGLDAAVNRGKLHDGLGKFFDHTALEKIRGAKIGIAGAGGLGSNCASFLVRSGFLNFVIADFDRVEETNLNRQFFFAHQIGMLKTDALRTNLRAIEPSLNLQLLTTEITRANAAEIFAGCDAVVEAFDGADSKAMLAEEISRLGIFFVCASGIAGHGGGLQVRALSGMFHIVGDAQRQVSKENPPLAPRVAMAAAAQADLVLNHILTRKKETRHEQR